MSKKIIDDPQFQREAEKYENPIPSREYIIEYLNKTERILKRDDLIKALGLQDDLEAQEALRRRLRAMERDGQLVFTRKGGYGVAAKMDLVGGRVTGHQDGFGFVIPDDHSPDLFLNAREMSGVFDGDRVLVRVAGIDRRGRREGAVAEILERKTKTLVGRFSSKDGVAFVTPENKRITQVILIPAHEQNGAKPGQIVTVEIISYPTFRLQAIGRIAEILGEYMAPGMEINVALRSYNIPYQWPEDVVTEVQQFTPTVSEQDKQNRIDLRHIPFVTIDGEDARDFDDAVYCELASGKRNWRLYVAIADVSHYVKPGAALDQEAFQRGNSVYFSGEVVPMLPEILSNELCSLKPQVDRVSMVCEMEISKKGKLKSYHFYPAIIHSQARLTYTEVTKLLEHPVHDIKYEHLLPHLQNLNELYHALYAERINRGAIDFETTETRVIFGYDRKIQKIVPTKRTVSHRIIEECMLLANVAAAEFLVKEKVPALYRIHNGPALEKLRDLQSFLAELGLRLPGNKIPEPKDYAQLLKSINGRADAHLIQTVLLRSLSQAVYSPDNSGHFGLAFTAYTHFTSPIRRYPDLLIHRAIKFALSKAKGKKFYYTSEQMALLGAHCSMTERRADEATREVLDWLKCVYMQEKVGQQFNGIITSVVGFGLFVELKDIYVEGLVHVSGLKNDYYHFDPKNHRMRGERTGQVFRLGDALSVRVVRVDLDARKIDFELDQPENNLLAKDKKSKKIKASGTKNTKKIAKNKEPTKKIKTKKIKTKLHVEKKKPAKLIKAKKNKVYES